MIERRPLGLVVAAGALGALTIATALTGNWLMLAVLFAASVAGMAGGVELGRSGGPPAPGPARGNTAARTGVDRAADPGQTRGAAASPGTRSRATARQRDREQLEADLRAALAGEDLIVRYQPIVELGTGRVVGFEAQPRWRHWARGLVPPSEFLPLAEEACLIGRLRGRMLEDAARKLSAWHAGIADSDSVTLTVAVSIGELSEAGFARRTTQTLHDAGLEPRHLVVAVGAQAATGTAPDQAAAELRRLWAAGTTVAVEDAHAAAPLERLRHHVPIGVLRVDRRAPALVRPACDLGFDVVVTGVESSAQREEALAAGCRYGQGFLFGRAMEAPEAEAFLGRRLIAVTPVPPSASPGTVVLTR